MEREADFRPFENIRDLPPLLRSFVGDPIGTMKKPMRLTWPAALSLQAGMAIISGVLNGALTRNFWDFLAGLIVFPVISVCLGLALAGFTHQFFAIFQSTYLEFRRLHSMVVVATLPYFLLHVIAGLVPPLDLIGYGAASLFLVVGLVSQFGLSRKQAMSFIGMLYLLFIVMWIIAQIRSL